MWEKCWGCLKNTPQTTSLCFEDTCGVRIKHLNPPKCTEGANLCPTTPMTSAFSSAPKDHSWNLSLCSPSCHRGELSEQAGHRVVEPQLSKYPNTDAGRCQPSLPQLQPADANTATAPRQGRKLQTQQCLNTNSKLTWQTNSLLHSPPGRSITEQTPHRQSPPCSRQECAAPRGSLTLLSGAAAGCCCLVMFSARHQQILFFCSWE